MKSGLQVESLVGRILPGESPGGTYLGDLGSPVLTDKPGGTGDAIQVLSSKSAANLGANSKRRIKQVGARHPDGSFGGLSPATLGR